MREFYDRTGHDIKDMLLSCFYRGSECSADNFDVVSQPAVDEMPSARLAEAGQHEASRICKTWSATGPGHYNVFEKQLLGFVGSWGGRAVTLATFHTCGHSEVPEALSLTCRPGGFGSTLANQWGKTSRWKCVCDVWFLLVGNVEAINLLLRREAGNLLDLCCSLQFVTGLFLFLFFFFFFWMLDTAWLSFGANSLLEFKITVSVGLKCATF